MDGLAPLRFATWLGLLGGFASLCVLAYALIARLVEQLLKELGEDAQREGLLPTRRPRKWAPSPRRRCSRSGHIVVVYPA